MDGKLRALGNFGGISALALTALFTSSALMAVLRVPQFISAPIPYSDTESLKAASIIRGRRVQVHS